MHLPASTVPPMYSGPLLVFVRRDALVFRVCSPLREGSTALRHRNCCKKVYWRLELRRSGLGAQLVKSTSGIQRRSGERARGKSSAFVDGASERAKLGNTHDVRRLASRAAPTPLPPPPPRTPSNGHRSRPPSPPRTPTHSRRSPLRSLVHRVARPAAPDSTDRQP